MTYYFEDPEKQAQLKQILDSWLDPHTGFRHHCAVKGLGADCIHFVAKVYEEMGLLIWKKGLIPDYSVDFHLHNTRSLLKEALDSKPAGINLEAVPIENPMNGDIMIAFYGKTASHAMIYFDGYIYQSVHSVGVVKINFKDNVFSKAIRYNYRVVV